MKEIFEALNKDERALELLNEMENLMMEEKGRKLNEKERALVTMIAMRGNKEAFNKFADSIYNKLRG